MVYDENEILELITDFRADNEFPCPRPNMSNGCKGGEPFCNHIEAMLDYNPTDPDAVQNCIFNGPKLSEAELRRMAERWVDIERKDVQDDSVEDDNRCPLYGSRYCPSKDDCSRLESGEAEDSGEEGCKIFTISDEVADLARGQR